MTKGGGVQVRCRGQIYWMRWQRVEGAKEIMISNAVIDNVKKKWFFFKTR